MFSDSEENYLKAIFHLERSSQNGVNTTALAQKMDTKPSSVTDMVKKLADKNLVNYKKYQGVKLSESGRTTAINVIRKHRLWEVFLVDKLEFSWAEVHEVAEQLEHIQSQKLTRQLDKFLGFPKNDPHGDPIPNEKGNIVIPDNILLSEMEEGGTGICIGVKDSSSEFLRFLDKYNIALGKKIKVLEKEEFDGSLIVELDGRNQSLSHLVSSNLYVKK